MKKLLPLLLVSILFYFSAFAQTDTIPNKNLAVKDTIVEKNSKKKEHKRVSDFKVYGGLSVDKILLSNSSYESASGTGYLLGFAYRQGRFFYWEIGANYNKSVVTLEGENIFKDNLKIGQLEVPLSGGINLLSATRRVLGIRLFGGVVPGYIIGVKDNPLALVDDDFNRFQVSGRVGLGLDVLFLFIELGYQYGFIDVLKDQDSNLSQVDFRLGFRF